MNPSISCKVNQFVGNAPRFGMIFLKDLNELSSHTSSPPIISSYYHSFAISYVYNLVKQFFALSRAFSLISDVVYLDRFLRRKTIAAKSSLNPTIGVMSGRTSAGRIR